MLLLLVQLLRRSARIAAAAAIIKLAMALDEGVDAIEVPDPVDTGDAVADAADLVMAARVALVTAAQTGSFGGGSGGC